MALGEVSAAAPRCSCPAPQSGYSKEARWKQNFLVIPGNSSYSSIRCTGTFLKCLWNVSELSPRSALLRLDTSKVCVMNAASWPLRAIVRQEVRGHGKFTDNGAFSWKNKAWLTLFVRAILFYYSLFFWCLQSDFPFFISQLMMSSYFKHVWRRRPTAQHIRVSFLFFFTSSVWVMFEVSAERNDIFHP